MKKAKVSALIEKFKREAHTAGREMGKREERQRYQDATLATRENSPIWIGPPPKAEMHSIMMPRGLMAYGFDPAHFDAMYVSSNTRVDFKLKQKGIVFSNGVSVRWADWEPMGPYPVVDFSDPPRRW